MRVNRSLLNWGVFLIALGGIPLAVDRGWLESDIAGDLGRLWPLILVGIGLGLILRWTPIAWVGGALVAATFGIILGAAAVTIRDDDFASIHGIIPSIASGGCGGGETGAATTSEGGLASPDEFELDVTLACGELEVVRSDGATWALEARHEPGEEPRVEISDGEGVAGRVRLSQPTGDDLAFFGRRGQDSWDVQVPAAAALRIHATLDASSGVIDAGVGPISRVAGTFNASEVDLDLAVADTPEAASVDLTLNASDGRLLLPAGDIGAGITLNASSLSICVPQAAALRIDHSSILSSDDLGDSGLARDAAGQWTTVGYADAVDRVSLSITSTVSSISLERPEVCS